MRHLKREEMNTVTMYSDNRAVFNCEDVFRQIEASTYLPFGGSLFLQLTRKPKIGDNSTTHNGDELIIMPVMIGVAPFLSSA